MRHARDVHRQAPALFYSIRAPCFLIYMSLLLQYRFKVLCTYSISTSPAYLLYGSMTSIHAFRLPPPLCFLTTTSPNTVPGVGAYH